jgi:tetratricopeptide (TPR) repeat protein
MVQAETAAAGAATLDVRTRARASWELGRAHYVLGRADEAATHLEASFYAAQSSASPTVAADAAAKLADIALQRERLADAETWLRHAEAALGRDAEPRRRIPLLIGRGNLEIARGRFEPARAALDEALALSVPDGFDAVVVYSNRARVHQALGDLGAAERDVRHALEIEERLLGAGHPELLITHAILGNILIERGRHDAAKRSIEAAVAIADAWLPPLSPEAGRLRDSLGRIAFAQGQLERAADHHRRALQILRATLDARDPEIAYTSCNLGRVEAARGRVEEALTLHREGLALLEDAYGGDHPDVAEALTGLGSALRDAGRAAEAEDALRRANAILAATRAGPSSK